MDHLNAATSNSITTNTTFTVGDFCLNAAKSSPPVATSTTSTAGDDRVNAAGSSPPTATSTTSAAGGDNNDRINAVKNPKKRMAPERSATDIRNDILPVGKKVKTKTSLVTTMNIDGASMPGVGRRFVAAKSLVTTMNNDGASMPGMGRRLGDDGDHPTTSPNTSVDYNDMPLDKFVKIFIEIGTGLINPLAQDDLKVEQEKNNMWFKGLSCAISLQQGNFTMTPIGYSEKNGKECNKIRVKYPKVGTPKQGYTDELVLLKKDHSEEAYRAMFFDPNVKTEYMMPQQLACFSPLLFWSLVKHHMIDGDAQSIEQVAVELIPENPNWHFLDSRWRVRKQSAKARENLRQAFIEKDDSESIEDDGDFPLFNWSEFMHDPVDFPSLQLCMDTNEKSSDSERWSKILVKNGVKDYKMLYNLKSCDVYRQFNPDNSKGSIPTEEKIKQWIKNAQNMLLRGVIFIIVGSDADVYNLLKEKHLFGVQLICGYEKRPKELLIAMYGKKKYTKKKILEATEWCADAMSAMEHVPDLGNYDAYYQVENDRDSIENDDDFPLFNWSEFMNDPVDFPSLQLCMDTNEKSSDSERWSKILVKNGVKDYKMLYNLKSCDVYRQFNPDNSKGSIPTEEKIKQWIKNAQNMLLRGVIFIIVGSDADVYNLLKEKHLFGVQLICGYEKRPKELLIAMYGKKKYTKKKILEATEWCADAMSAMEHVPDLGNYDTYHRVDWSNFGVGNDRPDAMYYCISDKNSPSPHEEIWRSALAEKQVRNPKALSMLNSCDVEKILKAYGLDVDIPVEGIINQWIENAKEMTSRDIIYHIVDNDDDVYRLLMNIIRSSPVKNLLLHASDPTKLLRTMYDNLEMSFSIDDMNKARGWFLDAKSAIVHMPWIKNLD